MLKNLAVACSTLFLLGISLEAESNSCPKLYKKSEFNLSFNPAFLHVDRYNDGNGLAISSFANRDARVPGGFFQRDLVARIPRVNRVANHQFNESDHLEILSDLDYMGQGPARTVWPNSVTRAPDGLVPFEAMIVPQGFLSTPFAGRLTLINLDDPDKTEYVIHQSGLHDAMGAFYHNVVIHDMDADGYDDIVSVRSTFNVILGTPPFGELVWFKNPGDALDPDTPWEETLLVGGPTIGFQGPDIHLTAHDFEGDGIPEIIATHFFTGGDGSPQPTTGKIAIYGAPAGLLWSEVNPFYAPVRSADISTDQGFPFDLEIVDLNKDGRVDILASNHQPDACRPFPTVPGRVYALEMPESGDLFNDPWPVHVLLDNIRPQPSLPGTRGLGRLAPGKATAFYEKKKHKRSKKRKPSIVVGGDEAGKVWVLRPEKKKKKDDWNYTASIIFDINDHYGEGTTQRVTDAGITVSTLGSVAVSYSRGKANLFIPVFEGKDIFVYSFDKKRSGERVECLEDVMLACPAPLK